MRRIVCFIGAGLLFGMLGERALAQGRIATIDLRKVFDTYWKTKQAELQFKDRASDMEKQYQAMKDDWKKAKIDYNDAVLDAGNQSLSSEERDKRKKSAEEKLKFLKDQEDLITQYERQARTTLEDQRKRIRDNILIEVRNVLNATAKAGGYGLVLDSSAESPKNSTPDVLYNGLENDLTEAVSSQLNATAPTEAQRPEDKTGEKKKDDKKN